MMVVVILLSFTLILTIQATLLANARGATVVANPCDPFSVTTNLTTAQMSHIKRLSHLFHLSFKHPSPYYRIISYPSFLLISSQFLHNDACSAYLESPLLDNAILVGSSNYSECKRITATLMTYNASTTVGTNQVRACGVWACSFLLHHSIHTRFSSSHFQPQPNSPFLAIGGGYVYLLDFLCAGRKTPPEWCDRSDLGGWAINVTQLLPTLAELCGENYTELMANTKRELMCWSVFFLALNNALFIVAMERPDLQPSTELVRRASASMASTCTSSSLPSALRPHPSRQPPQSTELPQAGL
jgi:hypothetical protein